MLNRYLMCLCTLGTVVYVDECMVCMLYYIHIYMQCMDECVCVRARCTGICLPYYICYRGFVCMHECPIS